jgi:hypothetical protein
MMLIAAAPAFSAPTGADLSLRARLLLREIRAQSTAGKKDTSALRAELSALEAENIAAPDDGVAANLRLAEADLTLVDSGSPLPPPTIGETISGDDLPDRDAVAQPPAPIFRSAAPAAQPDAAGLVFDGSGLHGAAGARAVSIPEDAPTADLDKYLPMTDDDEKSDFLEAASAGLLEKLNEGDEDGSRAKILAGRLMIAIAAHPLRLKFTSVHVRAPKDKKLHLVYRLRDGGVVDEILGPLSEWSRPSKGGGGGGGGKRHKKGAGGKKDKASDDSPQTAHKGHGGHKGRGAAGGGDGGGDGGGGGGGGSRHAKTPHVKGGGRMFDGGGSDGDGATAGPAGTRHGRDAGARAGRKADAAGGVVAASRGGASVSGSSSGSGRGRPHAGKYMSADNDDSGGAAGGHSNSASRKKRGGSTPLPKDFTTRGHGSRLDGEGGDGDGSGSSDGSGSGMGRFGRKGAHRDAPSTAASSSPGASPELARVEPSAAKTAAPSAAAPSPAALSMPLAADGDLHDAVAAHEAAPPPSAVPPASTAAAPASPPPPDSRPLAAACAVAAGIGLGAYAFRRSRRA